MKSTLYNLFFWVWMLCLAIPSFSQDVFDLDRTKLKEKILEYKKKRLTEILVLESKSESFFSKYLPLQRKAIEQQMQVRGMLRDLQQAVNSGKSNDEIQKKTELLLYKEQEFQATTREFLKQMKPVLNEEQFAKLVVFEAKFPYELQRVIMKKFLKKRMMEEDDDY